MSIRRINPESAAQREAHGERLPEGSVRDSSLTPAKQAADAALKLKGHIPSGM
jgi:hypothetical protein